LIVPSIDLMNGKAVQLERGKRKVLERDDVRELAVRFGRYGQVALIDLDAALGRGDNRPLIKELCRTVQAYVGGGIRTPECAYEYLRAGATHVIIGTAASAEFFARLPRRASMVAVDASAGRVTVRGWTESVAETPVQRAARLGRSCAGVLYTAVDREGVFGGADMATAAALREVVEGKLIIAGGIWRAEEIKALDRLGADAQVGMALYNGRLDPATVFAQLMAFERTDGLIPTVVCDAGSGRVRMLAYSNAESLQMSLRQGVGAYYSRSRRRIWIKGETSGNRQELVRVEADCDRDTLCFYVRQSGPSCHTGAARCFGTDAFTWHELVSRIASRASADPLDSFTARVLADPRLLSAKLGEEAAEVAGAESHDDVAWEVADLLYFASVKMQASGVSIDDVMAQLRSRAT